MVFCICGFSLLFQVNFECCKVWCCMAMLENVVFEEHNKEVDYLDKSIILFSVHRLQLWQIISMERKNFNVLNR